MNRITLTVAPALLAAPLLLGQAATAAPPDAGTARDSTIATTYRLLDPMSRHIRSWYLREVGIASEGLWSDAATPFGRLGGAPVGFRAVLGYAGATEDGPPRGELAEQYRLLLGFDIAPRDDWVLGIVLGYADSGLEIDPQGDALSVTGFSIAPYVALSLGSLSLDLSVGYSNLAGDDLVPGLGGRRYGEAVLPLGVGDLAGERRPWQLGADVGYTVGNWKPYVSGVLEHDLAGAGLGLEAPGSGGPSGILGVGLRYLGDYGLSGGLEYDTTLGRELDDHRLNLFIRGEFD